MDREQTASHLRRAARAIASVVERLESRICLTSYAPYLSPSHPIDVGGTLFFLNSDKAHGMELWKTDGTPEGTSLVEDIRPGKRSSEIGDLTAVGKTLYFTADDGTHGQEIWKSDGTEAGTAMVADLSSDGYWYPDGFVAVGDMLFFAGAPHGNTTYLYKTDGTAAGTVAVKSLGEPLVDNFSVVDGTLFFLASDYTSADRQQFHCTLWRSDGTPEGTTPVTQFPDTSNSMLLNEVQPLGASQGKLFLRVTYEKLRGRRSTDYVDSLWSSDGTAPGTISLMDLPDRGIGLSGDAPIPDGPFLFLTSSAGSTRLWKSDGTPAGTVPVTDVPWPESRFVVWATAVANLDGRYLFNLNNAGSGALWATDGTAAGTVRLADVGATGWWPGTPAQVGHALYYTAQPTRNSLTVWKTDGTPQGTSAVVELAGLDVNLGFLGSSPDLTASGDQLFLLSGTARYGSRDRSATGTLWRLEEGPNTILHALAGRDHGDRLLIEGTAADDTLTATTDGTTLTVTKNGISQSYPLADITGLTINALAGNDSVTLGAGLPAATILGGDGHDTLTGSDGADLLRGEAGHDSISGGAGNDTLRGGSGNDTLKGDAGDDNLQGGLGADVLRGGAGSDALSGDDGPDRLFGGAGRNQLDGGPGRNRLVRTSSEDRTATANLLA